jgi:DNA invertase Pin-like site-specific DNA recombinase
MKQVRCAIYTRKSSEEGLEQGFNSLHAQREACAAYVLSQASEGWTLLPDDYDDGGISGGTLERPALQQLLADIAAGKVDIVVVYKVDRLTRSLLDFAKLVEAFDKADTSFVSITQSFNTTTSMGRLTLNMLLSFAQFEREVTAERIRDKLAASKAKGMWMGGVPPLGYKPDGRTLAIVEPHAALIRDIYARYLALGNVREVTDALCAEGIVVPRRTTGTGKALGGAQFSRGQIYSILKSPIYVGDIPHRDKIAPGNHQALIEREQWDAVQQLLAGHVKGERSPRTPKTSPLAGKIFDTAGEPLFATHTAKPGQIRYRYYVSKALHLKTGDTGFRLPAREVEQLVSQALAELFSDPLSLIERAELELPPSDLQSATSSAALMAAKFERGGAGFPQFILRIEVSDAGLSLHICAQAIGQALALGRREQAPATFMHTCAVKLTRTGRAIRLVHDNGALAAGREGVDTAMLKLIVKARAWWAELAQGEMTPTALAEREGITVPYVIRVTRLAFLSPKVIEGILAGRLRGGIDSTVLLKAGTITADWEEQERQLLAG